MTIEANRAGRLGPRGALTLSVCAAASSSASGTFGKALVLSGWSTGGVLLPRTMLAVLVLLPWALWAARRHGVVWRGNLRGVLVLGVVGIGGTVMCYYNAVTTLPIGVAMMVLYISPVLVLGWICVRHRERPAATTVAGAATALGGLALVVTAMGVERPSPGGLAWALGGAVCVATYFLSSDSVSPAVPPTVLACAGLTVAGACIALLGVSGLLPMRMSSAPVDLGGWSVPPIVPLLLVACLSTAFVYVAGFTAVSVLGARVTSFVALAEPIAALGVAWLLLGETPRPVQLVGCALIVLGVVLIRADSSGRLRRGVKADADRAPFLPDPG